MEIVIFALSFFPPHIRKRISGLLAGAATIAMAGSVRAGDEPRPAGPVPSVSPPEVAAAETPDRDPVSATLPKYSHAVEIAPYVFKVVIQESGDQILVILVISRALHTPAISSKQVMLVVYDSSGAKLKLTPPPQMGFLGGVIQDAGGATDNKDYLIDRKAAGAAAEAEVTLLGKSARMKLFDHDPDSRKAHEISR
jgi:hypothetical protein